MKKKICVSMVIVLILIVSFIVMYAIDMNRMKNNKPVVFCTWGYQYVPPISDEERLQEDLKDIVIIKDNKIKNEYLIDEFMVNTDYTKNESQELNILQDGQKIKITYTPGEYAKQHQKSTEGETINYTGWRRCSIYIRRCTKTKSYYSR